MRRASILRSDRRRGNEFEGDRGGAVLRLKEEQKFVAKHLSVSLASIGWKLAFGLCPSIN